MLAMEVEYHGVVNVGIESIWIQHLFGKLVFLSESSLLFIMTIKVQDKFLTTLLHIVR